MKKQNKDLTVVGLLRQSYDQLVKENKELKKENKEYKDTMNQMIKEAWKLKQLVDKLREAIEEEKN
jgi:cell division protein FtsB|tara:strand:+ start:130 stop:327 length:198 start_codon:yes stop_codon:yes gene_type:complete